MEACYLLLIYILITQPKVRFSDEHLNYLRRALSENRIKEIKLILEENKVLLNPKTSYLQKHTCINRQRERLQLHFPTSTFEAPVLPSLKSLAIHSIHQQCSFIQRLSFFSHYSLLMKKLNALSSSIRKDLGLEDKHSPLTIPENRLVKWMNLSTSTDIENINETFLPILHQALVRYNLHYTNSERISVLHVAALLGNEEIINHFLQTNVKEDINKADNIGNRPLHYALESGREQNGWRLIESGATLQVANHLGMTPLHLAAYWGRPRLVEYLLKQGLSVNSFGDEELTHLHTLKVWNSSIYSLLTTNKYLWQKIVNYNQRYGIPDQGKLEFMHYWTPLCLAVVARHEAVVEVLLHQGALILECTKVYKIQPLLLIRISYPSDFFAITSPSIARLLKQTLLKRDLKQLFMQLHEYSDHSSFVQHHFQNFKQRLINQSEIEIVLHQLNMGEEVAPELLARYRRLLEHSFSQPLSPLALNLNPEELRQFLITQIEPIQRELQQVENLTSSLREIINSQDKLKEWIHQADLTSLVGAYVYYRRRYLQAKKESWRTIDTLATKINHPLLVVCYILWTMLLTCIYLIVAFTYFQAKEPTLLGNLLKFIIAFVLGIISGVTCYFVPLICSIVYQHTIYAKINAELQKLNEHYPPFEASPLLTFIVKSLAEQAKQETVITLSTSPSSIAENNEAITMTTSLLSSQAESNSRNTHSLFSLGSLKGYMPQFFKAKKAENSAICNNKESVSDDNKYKVV